MSCDQPPLAYVLVTAARNEAAYIGLTIRSVVAQSVRPIRWVIVSDGSTDATDAIVREQAARHPWIELVRIPEHQGRHFAAKVECFNAGYARVRHLDYHLIGSLDADLSFDEDYFGFLLARFAENPALGVAGTPFREGRTVYDFRFTSPEHVPGVCQLFRRECFEAIQGYLPVKEGGIDVIAASTARMKGWQTRSFVERTSTHHRPMGSAAYGAAVARFKLGERDYLLGGHPLWQLSRSLYQMTRSPRLAGGCMLLCGYLWALCRRAERPVSREFVRFRRREQMRRLRQFIRGLTPRWRHRDASR